MTTENWKPIPGFEGHYEVSDHGQIRSLDRPGRDGRRLAGRVMRQSTSAAGYRRVNLVREGTHFTQLVHRAVLLAFVGPCPDGMEACHGPSGPADNRLSNLRWGTHSDNNLDRVAYGTHQHSRKIACKRGHAYIKGNVAEARVAKHGRRQCLACQRAWTDAKRHRVPLTQELADRWFARLTGEAA